ncbi:MAG TPA: peptide-methionine (S)-S-oxide reductase MsrA [Nitrososphaera sp.]|nr:peptide-methionine (S)-S-oxide reductase MsrA [Nitrososphaera sp.]
MDDFVLGGGCFWCLDAVYRQLKGVTSVESGYAGGHTDSPSYYQVASGSTGHAEVVRVSFDAAIIPADIILDAFFLSHDPTTPNRQGADIGTQYRSIMLYQNSEQKDLFEAALKRAQTRHDNPVVTEIVPLATFYPAEPEHEDYYTKNPEAGYCQVVIEPKIIKARAALRQWLKQ